MSCSHALGTWGDFKNHIIVNRMSQTLWHDLQRLELVLFCFMVSKNNTDEKRRHKRLFFLILVSPYLTSSPLGVVDTRTAQHHSHEVLNKLLQSLTQLAKS